MEITRIFDILELHKTLIKPDALCGKSNGDWQKISNSEFVENTDFFSNALMSLGISKDDKIALISPNCPEWNIIDLGIIQIGAVTVPIYPNISESEYKYILTHSDAKLVFIYSETIYNKIKNILPKSNIVFIITEIIKYGRHDINLLGNCYGIHSTNIASRFIENNGHRKISHIVFKFRTLV